MLAPIQDLRACVVNVNKRSSVSYTSFTVSKNIEVGNLVQTALEEVGHDDILCHMTLVCNLNGWYALIYILWLFLANTQSGTLLF